MYEITTKTIVRVQICIVISIMISIVVVAKQMIVIVITINKTHSCNKEIVAIIITMLTSYHYW